MKFRRGALLLALCAAFSLPLFAEENPVEYSLGVDFAFYPKWNHPSTGGSDSFYLGFAEFGGIYNNLEGRINLSAAYTIDTPLGSHWLLKSANVKVTETLEISPVSIAPSVTIAFTPLPFIVLQAGFKAGTGWDIGNVFSGGMSIYNAAENKYEAAGAFENLFAKYWVQGTFQFDTGAIFKGDWTHLQLMYSYQTYFEGMTGAASQDLWAWQCTSNKVNGLKEYQQLILAYAMPLKLSRVGFIFESDRYYSDNVYSNAAYMASMADYNLSAMAQLSLSQKDTLTILANFASRRTYETYDASLPESMLTTSGMEWYFKRLALSYSHKF